MFIRSHIKIKTSIFSLFPLYMQGHCIYFILFGQQNIPFSKATTSNLTCTSNSFLADCLINIDELYLQKQRKKVYYLCKL